MAKKYVSILNKSLICVGCMRAYTNLLSLTVSKQCVKTSNMAHGLSFKEMAQQDAMCSENIKKALNINSAYNEDLKKDLSCLQKERRSLMNSLTKQKLDFLQLRKSKLPLICRTRSGSESESTVMQQKVAEFCKGALTKNSASERGGSSTPHSARLQSQPSSNQKSKFYQRQKSTDSGGNLSTSLDSIEPLDGQEIDDHLQAAWLASPADGGGNDFKTMLGNTLDTATLSSPGVRLPAPRSPILSQLRSSNTLDEGRRSLPCSPRMERRRANTLDTPVNFVYGGWTNSKIALERSLSTPTAKLGARLRVQASPIDLEDVDKGRFPPRAPSSPQIRRLCGFQPIVTEQAQTSQEDLFHFPKLRARGSLPNLSKDEGTERHRRRVNSLTRNRTAKELSPRTEAINHRSVSPRPAEKQQTSLDIGKEWLSESFLKAELPEAKVHVEDDKDSPRLMNEDLCFWNSDDDDEDTDEEPFPSQKEKKTHSVDEIKHTRYLRMKPPHHWLPKMGNVPKELLSSSIIVGHTKVAFESVSTEGDREGDEEEGEREKKRNVNQNSSCEEKEDGEIGDYTE